MVERRCLGVDYGVSRIAISGPSHGVFEEYVLKPGDNLGALDVLAEITWNTVTHAHAEVVAIESPIQGMSRNVRVGIQLGMVAGALAVAARQAGADVIFAEPATWKKAVVGFGNANKADVSAFLEGHHPRLYAKCPSQDMVDATCIALYAERSLAG
jgi:Holliday junction resolvasome RuvABC endonuclease subunit